MPEYLLVLRDGPNRPQSDDEYQQALDRYLAWNQQMRQEQRFVHCSRLSQTKGKRMSRQDTIDGAFVEAKEVIAGFYLICADSMEEASTVAGQCPILLEGGTVDVFEVHEDDRLCQFMRDGYQNGTTKKEIT